MITIARFMIRPTFNGDGGDVILGKLLADVPSGLKGGLVYEIREFDGVFTVEPVGPSAASRDFRMNSLHTLLRNRHLLITAKEAEAFANIIGPMYEDPSK